MTQTTAPSPQKSGGGCFPPMLMLMGILTAIFAVVGYIAGLFGYVLKVKGSKLPFIDLPIMLILLGCALFFFGTGYGIDLLVTKIRNRKKS
jgi:hypothetical protein